MKKQIAGESIVLAYDTPNEAAAASALLAGNALILEQHDLDASLHLVVERGGEALPHLLRALGDGGVQPKSIQLNRPSLDDVFLKLTGRTLRDSEESHEA